MRSKVQLILRESSESQISAAFIAANFALTGIVLQCSFSYVKQDVDLIEINFNER